MRGRRERQQRRRPVSRRRNAIDEEELIRQIETRPILYDRTLKANRKPNSRFKCWKELSVVMNAAPEECQRRWRTLRDTFSKNYKLIKEGNKKDGRQWAFYESMSFMSKFLDQTSNLIETSDDDSSTNLNEMIVSSNDDVVADTTNESNQHEHNVPVEVMLETPELPVEPVDPTPEETPTTSHAYQSDLSLPEKEAAAVEALENLQQSSYIYIPTDRADADSDSNFLRSCVPTLKRLSQRKNSLARYKIQSILYQIEFGEEPH